MTPTDINREADLARRFPIERHTIAVPPVIYFPLQALRGGDSFLGAALVFVSVGAVIGLLVLGLGVFG
jgi:hypothetical protein